MMLDYDRWWEPQCEWVVIGGVLYVPPLVALEGLAAIGVATTSTRAPTVGTTPLIRGVAKEDEPMVYIAEMGIDPIDFYMTLYAFISQQEVHDVHILVKRDQAHGARDATLLQRDILVMKRGTTILQRDALGVERDTVVAQSDVL